MEKRETQNNYVIYEDEIDLYEIWLKIKKRYKIIVGTVFFFVALSLIYIFIAKPIYEEKFTIKLPSYANAKPLLTPQEVKGEIRKLDNLARLKRYEELSFKLNLKKEIVSKMVSIRANSIRGVNDVIEINIKVTDPSIVRLISLKTIDYLNNKKCTKEFIRTVKSQLEEEINEIEKTIRKLYDIKKIIESNISKGQPIYFNPADIDKAILAFSNRLYELKFQLKTLKGFEISVEPEVPLNPTKPKKALIIAVSFVSSLFIGIFLALFLEWLEEAKKRHYSNGRM